MVKADDLLKDLRQRGIAVSPYRSSVLSPLSRREDGFQLQSSEISSEKWQRSLSLDLERVAVKEQSNVLYDVEHRSKEYPIRSSSVPSRGVSPSRLLVETASSLHRLPLKELPSPMSPNPALSRWTAEDEILELDRKLARMRQTLAKLESDTATLNRETGQIKEKLNQDLQMGKRSFVSEASKRELWENCAKLTKDDIKGEMEKPALSPDRPTDTARLASHHPQDSELTLNFSSSSEAEEDETLSSPRSEVRDGYKHDVRSQSSGSVRSTGPWRPPIPARGPLSNRPSPLKQIAIFEKMHQGSH